MAPNLSRRLNEITVDELIEIISLHELGVQLTKLNHRLVAIEQVAIAIRAIRERQEQIMGALEDLQAVDADLAAAVTDLSGAVDRIDTDFTALEQKLGDGVAAGDVEAEVTKLRESIDAAKAAKANVDTADPAAPTT